MRCYTKLPMAFPQKPFDKTGWPWESSNISRETAGEHACLPRITIVTPSFNQAQFLEETIRSVLLQGYPNLEYIIIDGGSGDGSVEIIKKYEPWLAYWISEPDGGQAHAINKGFARSTGEIMGYLNSDDMLAPDALWHVSSALATRKSRRNFVLSFAGLIFDKNGPIHLERPRKHQILTPWFETNYCLSQPSTFWCSSLYHRIGGFDESMTFCLDKDFFIRALFGPGSGDYVVCPEFVASLFRSHASSKTSTLTHIHKIEHQVIKQKYGSKEPYASVLRKEEKASKHETEVLHALSSNNFCTALLHLYNALILSPRNALTRFYLGACRRIVARVFCGSVT